MLWGLFILFGVAWALLAGIGTWVLAHRLTHPPRHTVGGAVARGLLTDPIEAGGARYETQTLAAEDGTPMELWSVPGGEEGGPVVVILHGWGDSRLGALLWQEALMPAVSRLVFFDLRAHGESLHKVCAWGVREVGDTAKVVEWITQTHPEKPVVLFGYSMGAVIAIKAAARIGGTVTAVVADSPYLTVESVVGAVLKLNRLPRWPVLPLALAWLRRRGVLAHEADTAQPAAMLWARLLVLHGDGDRVVKLEEAQKITAAAGGLMHVFEGCDHLEAVGKCSEEYANVVRDFIKNGSAIAG